MEVFLYLLDMYIDFQFILKSCSCISNKCVMGVGLLLPYRKKSFFYLFFIILDLFRLLGTKSACSASYGIKKPPITKPTGAREKTINPSPSGPEPIAHQPHQIRNLPLTRRSKRKIQIDTWGGINRKTLAVDTNKGNELL